MNGPTKTMLFPELGHSGAREPSAAADSAALRSCAERASTSSSWLLASLSTHTLAIADQAIVSGANFATTILIARFCGAGELGIYSIGYSLIIASMCLQESLVALPYNIYRHRPLRGTADEYAGSILTQNMLLTALAVVAVICFDIILWSTGAMPEVADLTWVLAGVLPLAMLREFGRRFSFAHLRTTQVFLLDLTVAVIQLTGLGYLAMTGGLSARSAYLVLGTAGGIAGVAWLCFNRRQFQIVWSQVWPTVVQSWRFGKWFCANQVTVMIQQQMPYWLLALVVSPAATGVYAACVTLVRFSNPIILGFNNTLLPRTAQAFGQEGARRPARVVLRNTLTIGLTIAAFCTVLMVFSEDIISLLYKADQYDGHGHVVVVLAASLMAYALGIPATQALAAIEHPEAAFKAALVALAVSVVLVPLLILEFGLIGAAYGTLSGTLIGTAGRWTAYRLLMPRNHRSGQTQRI